MRPRLHDKIPPKLRELIQSGEYYEGGTSATDILSAISAALSRSYRRGYIAGHLAARRPKKRAVAT